MVDEYQDVTPLQQRVLDAWLGERDDLTVVGDANQTIYTFAGATPRYLLDFPRRFPEAVLVRLERDYRSTPQVVAAANQLIGTARGPAGRHPAAPGRAAARRARSRSSPSTTTSRPRRRRWPRGSPRLIADGTPAAEIAVLFRINAQSEAYEQALTEAGVPYQVRGGRAVLPAPRGAPGDDRAARWRGAGRRGRCPTPCAPCWPRSGSPRSRPAGPPGAPSGSRCSRWSSWPRSCVAVEPDADLRRFVAELQTRADAAHAPTVQGVTLASLHAAKGLEWDAVFLVGLADGTLPIQHADGTTTAIEEERRLLYVGITRARRRLPLSWALSRQPGGAPAPAPQPLPVRADPRSPPGIPGRRPGAGPAPSRAAGSAARRCSAPRR